jgi:hypothetical protein
MPNRCKTLGGTAMISIKAFSFCLRQITRPGPWVSAARTVSTAFNNQVWQDGFEHTVNVLRPLAICDPV